MLPIDAVKYLPAEHVVFFAEQDVTPFVPTLYSVDAHAVHVESSLLSVAAVKYSPAGHAVFFNEHGP